MGKIKPYRQKLALVIPAHNEELVLEKTVTSALSAGLAKTDIYIINDSSKDATLEIAKQLVPESNITSVRARHKGMAVSRGINKLCIISRYEWIHIADADCAFESDYFTVIKERLDNNFAAATGYIQSMKTGFISSFRQFEYTVGMELYRRTQSWLNAITVIPGPSSVFQSKIFNKLDWTAPTLTEDFDVTLQIHRNKTGAIQYIPQCKVLTQDPLTFKDYTNQVYRWNKGVMQSLINHRIGSKARMLDMYLIYQIFQSLLFFASYLLFMPIISIVFAQPELIAQMFLVDVLFTLMVAVAVSARTKRYDILIDFPYIYFYRWVLLGVFMKAFMEVIVLRQGRHDNKWSTRARRYEVSA